MYIIAEEGFLEISICANVSAKLKTQSGNVYKAETVRRKIAVTFQSL